MKTKLFSITTLLIVLAIAWSCNSPKATEPTESTETEAKSETETESKTDLSALVGKWCDAHPEDYQLCSRIVTEVAE